MLSRLAKIRLIQLLAQELEQSEGGLIEPDRSYPVWSPDRAFAAAATLLQMLADVKGNEQNRWDMSFADQEINSFFQEDFVNYREAESLRRVGVSDPRVAIDEGCIRIAFRYGTGFWSTVVSYDLRIWTLPK